MNKMLEASERPRKPSKTRSPTIAPMSLPLGPPLTQPTEQTTLPMTRASPITAAGMGKQMPAMKCMTRQEGANSTKLQCARWALLKRYHCSYGSLAEQRPLPMSGQPPFSISAPVAVLCASPKFVFMNSSVKTSPRILPGKKKPMRRISKAMSTPTSRTYPQSEESDQVKAPLTAAPAWITYMCIYFIAVVAKDIISVDDQKKQNYQVRKFD